MKLTSRILFGVALILVALTYYFHDVWEEHPVQQNTGTDKTRSK
jgi:hypothetical protein